MIIITLLVSGKITHHVVAMDTAAVYFEEVVDKIVPIRERPEWSDIQPSRGPDLGEVVVQPVLDPADADLLAYFWAGVNKDERSERMLRLSQEIIENLNAAHYTVWEWRWRCIEALGGLSAVDGRDGSELARSEASFLQHIAQTNAKNYQLWNHRRKFALARGPKHVHEEMAFSELCLLMDAKNYHAWAHRQAMISFFGGDVWENELQFTKKLLEDDSRNNSAWNQRSFVLSYAASEANMLSKLPGNEALSDLYAAELAFVSFVIRKTPHNEAAWAFIESLVRLGLGKIDMRCDESAKCHPSVAQTVRLSRNDVVIELCEWALKEDPSNVPALSVFAECLLAKQKILRISQREVENERVSVVISRMNAICEVLLEKLQIADPIRRAYWRSKMQY